MKPFAAALAVVAAWAIAAQADSRVEAAERKMTSAYTALVGSLDGPAKAHLLADQARWAGDRGACDADPPRTAECLEFRYGKRTRMLVALAKGPYPFISRQAIVQSGDGPNGRYIVDIAYPRFDGQSADFVAINQRLAAAAEAEAADAKATGGSEIAQAFSLYRLGPSVVSVIFWREWVGATIAIDLNGYLVDLSTGRMLGPQDVFTSGFRWRHRLADLVAAELAKDPPDADRKVKSSDIAAVMRAVEPEDYLFEDDGLVLSLSTVARERGMKGYQVFIPYAALKSILRADGPLGSLQR